MPTIDALDEILEERRPSAAHQATKDRLRAAFAKAERQSTSAFEAYREQANKDQRGLIVDGSGGAFAYIRTSRQVKKALLELGMVVPQRGLKLLLHAFGVPEQAITAQEIAVQAGIASLELSIGDLGTFWMESRMD